MTVKVAMQWHCVNTEADVETGNWWVAPHRGCQLMGYQLEKSSYYFINQNVYHCLPFKVYHCFT